jgi:ppGpp synthetase/RelA/SpoT-type nucleotidyltranferase
MATRNLSDTETQAVEALVRLYEDEENQERLTFLLNSLRSLLGESKALGRLAHSLKSRLKTVKSLRSKLGRQIVRDVDKLGIPFHINGVNFFTEINDLVGCRILHLHTRQMQAIDAVLRKLFEEAPFELLEGYPKAKVWDDESRKYFEGIGIPTEPQERMYSSVHYVIASSSRFRLTAEIQVRTLAQELWGEVDHKLNYPEESEFLSCREQIRSLAWVASSCTRLVDSIFATHAHAQSTADPLAAAASAQDKDRPTSDSAASKPDENPPPSS